MTSERVDGISNQSLICSGEGQQKQRLQGKLQNLEDLCYEMISLKSRISN